MSNRRTCAEIDAVYDYALDTLTAAERARVEAHLQGCAVCSAELAGLQPLVAGFDAWPTDVLRPSSAVWERLAERVGIAPADRTPSAEPWREPEWAEAAPGIFCKLLTRNPSTEQVTMLVRLLPNTAYPPHTHAGIEELWLLDGELWIEDRLLYAGDYNRGEPGTSDARVFSETGCTCVLITSARDILR